MAVTSVMIIGLGKLWIKEESQWAENWENNCRNKWVDIEKHHKIFPIEIRDCDMLIKAVGV